MKFLQLLQPQQLILHTISNVWSLAVWGNNLPTSLLFTIKPKKQQFYSKQPLSTMWRIKFHSVPCNPISIKINPSSLTKEDKAESCFKTISISDVAQNSPESIYDVPLDLSKLERKNKV